ncbi:hypothetical protein Tco_1577285 [Tanacetum coccineum]
MIVIVVEKMVCDEVSLLVIRVERSSHYSIDNEKVVGIECGSVCYDRVGGSVLGAVVDARSGAQGPRVCTEGRLDLRDKHLTICDGCTADTGGVRECLYRAHNGVSQSGVGEYGVRQYLGGDSVSCRGCSEQFDSERVTDFILSLTPIVLGTSLQYQGELSGDFVVYRSKFGVMVLKVRWSDSDRYLIVESRRWRLMEAPRDAHIAMTVMCLEECVNDLTSTGHRFGMDSSILDDDNVLREALVTGSAHRADCRHILMNVGRGVLVGRSSGVRDTES